MQIQQIAVYLLRLPQHYRVGGQIHTPNRLPGTDYYVEPQWVHAYSSVLESCVVKITADDGTFGWGEVQAPLSPQTPAALITTLLGPALLGQEALATAALHDRLCHLMLARGHTGSFIADAMAGLDIALWDLKARRYEVPLHELLGGPYRRELPAYVSGLRVPGVEEKAALARRLVAAGYLGVKLFSGANPTELEIEARSVRAAIGAKAFLAVDAICKYDLPEARRVGAVLDELRADWFEAPLGANDLEGHARLARTLVTPVAVGETLRTPRQFEPWLRAGAMAVAQPDVMRAGVTGTLRIAALADAAHVPVTLHTGVCTGIGMAATWQVAAALCGDLPQEHQEDLFAIAGSVLCTPLEQRAGRLIVPERPGIGVEVDETAVRRLATEHWMVDASGRRRESQTEA
jgi:D-galactarolactone cycloisomerase